jgi:hypothetical protein
MHTMTATERLLAIEAIKALKARYFRCLDTKDWAGYLAVFTPDAVIDTSEAFSPKDHSGAPLPTDGVVAPAPGPDSRIEDITRFVAELSKTLEGVSTVHHGHMPEIEVTSPTTATGIWSMEDKLRWPRGGRIREMHGYGHYRETYQLLDQGWRIRSLKLTRLRIDSNS